MELEVCYRRQYAQSGHNGCAETALWEPQWMDVGGGREAGETLLGLRTSEAALPAVEAQVPRAVAIKADDARHQYIRV